MCIRDRFFTVYTIASLAVRLLFSRTSDRYGRVPVLFFSSIMLAVSMVMLVQSQSLVWFWGAAICYGMSWGMNTPTLQAWTVDLSDERTRGRAVATVYIALEAGIGLGAVASGWMLNHYASEAGIPASFALAGVLALIAVTYLVWCWQQSRGK